jgi:2-dehydropantoate 2-reductase
MGSVFGGRLAEAGADLLLVDVSQALVDRLNGDGLRLDGPGGPAHLPVRATTTVAEVGPVDGVFFFVKCNHTRDAAELARPLVGPATALISLQNGWGNGDALAEAYGPNQLVVGVTYISATVKDDGRVAYSGNGPTVLGPWTGEGEPLADLAADWLRATGMDVERPADIRAAVWKKLVLNAATLPTAALTRLAAGPLGSHDQMAALVRLAAIEAVAAGRAQGYDLDEQERVETIADVLARAGAGRASMLQDVDAGRRTEIDVISGAVLRAADAHGLDLPVTRTLYALVKGLETGQALR